MRLRFWKKTEFNSPSYDGKLVCENHYLEMSEQAQKTNKEIEVHALGCEFCTEEKRFNRAVGLLRVCDKSDSESERETVVSQDTTL